MERFNCEELPARSDEQLPTSTEDSSLAVGQESFARSVASTQQNGGSAELFGGEAKGFFVNCWIPA
ncbi:MAG: hypothetical protein A3G33_00530 [Omnitrophica bacterium RIFCSPLOWO2_12_FULL_44_17]|uniref:Uncharacterized protein n=1 Tax=Candidatus Danuiimicrobium aquiferis TaxID=1801832 RepID=A0A1G1L181_9BACT|nr:MAG: hypothetical protein A3B72_04895 [Omnitrophica bacterium RIFCSPHIGHO2_02_FULL_45_28]OGW91361.1 MAG: hypothetical protein A3E74_09225 [Omnitrophica bacterium RIFCSPHIGHO2_12_FULL_44_12]OGW98913.1 MAG: hypothetical protein A3G33_00530 [Omnitrophica bacterium RIFCSPLOWO2_12_FULL_44_17]OGX03223.1 MAG: hypothetical protein A3J12_09175 [Omnitrophica bacterium RIFCSPLOWO2_02_FULL_44_11]